MSTIRQPKSQAVEWNFLQAQGFTSNWKRYLTQATIYFLQIGQRLFAIEPLTSYAYVDAIHTASWTIVISVATFYAYSNKMAGGYTLSGLVTSLLFLSEMLAHLTLLLESTLTRTRQRRILEMFTRIDGSLRKKLRYRMQNQKNTWDCVDKLLPLIILLTTVILAITWTYARVQSFASVLYWYSYLSALAIKFRLLQLLLAIIRINGYIKLIQHNLDAIGKRNLYRLFGLSPARRLWQKAIGAASVWHSGVDIVEERQLAVLKNLHNEIFLLFAELNHCFGWSLLIIIASYFIDLLCNSYLLFVAVLTQGGDVHSFIQNGGFVLMVVVMLTTLCWHCQKSYESSRYIGCLIYKLVKPLGNKRYNDLVSEFSLQTLHQQYIITAKQFFELNLNLLGSMVAAIVTYLVILIQFMLAEKNSTGSNSTTTVIAIMDVPTTARAMTTVLPNGLLLPRN